MPKAETLLHEPQKFIAERELETRVAQNAGTR
jgi:hypothetical protein